jgi:Tfp pilus assembly protein PilE
MNTRSRRAFTLFQLLVILAFLAILFALALPAIAKARVEGIRRQSQNNMKQIALGMHAYHDVYGMFPPGNDDNNFSAFAKVLPFIEQDNLYNMIDFKKPMDDKANAAVRKTELPVFLNPLDKVKSVSADYGATNYMLCSGSKPALTENNGVFGVKGVTLAIIANGSGTSNTMMTGETLKGDSAVKATTVKRQHVLLKKDDLKDVKDDAGVKDWENNKNIAADRGASWMDGRFLQSTFTATRTLNDDNPDVNCAGFGGLSGLRSEEDKVNIGMADGSVRTVSSKVKLEVWQILGNFKSETALPPDF